MASGGFTPRRLGVPGAAHEAHFIAAPLLTAAALSLAGVVGGAPDKFKWPGWTLLLLVLTAMTLILSIQLGYYALQFRFDRSAVIEANAIDRIKHGDEQIDKEVRAAFFIYRTYIERAMNGFSLGTVLLGLGIAAALVPPPCSDQANWRTAAAVLVLVCTTADGLWILYVRSKT